MDAHIINSHDRIVVGASAGGLQALDALLESLPPDLPAALFVVVHIGATSHLSRVLARKSRLPVRQAVSGETIKRGIVYVAGPDAHLLLHEDHILLRRGPRENMARPAIDPLFRSAAASFRGRVIGVVLSGALNDGTAGLLAIKRCGGLAVVQNPAEAAVPDMPRSAMRHVDVDHVVDSAEMGPLLARLVRERAGPEMVVPLDIRMETAIAAQELSGMTVEDQLGAPSRFTCPECHGALWEIEDGDIVRYRCHVGHGFTADALLSAQTTEIDVTLETLLRSHQERAALARRMARRERTKNSTNLASHFEARAKEYEENAQLLRKLMSQGSKSTAQHDENQG